MAHGVDPNVLKQFLKDSGLRFSENARSYIFPICPRCRGKKKVYVQKSDGRFACMKCKESNQFFGRPEFLFAELLGLQVKQVQGRLYDGDVPMDVYLDVRIEDFFGDEELDEEEIVRLPVLDWPYNFYPIDEPEAERGRRYLAGRGVPAEVALRYGVRYCPEQRRVVFPVEANGELYGWQARTVLPTTWEDPRGVVRELLKIVSSPGIPRERTLMFADRLRGQTHAVLAEGPLDAIKADLCGGNVSAMGKAVTPEQMRILLYGGVRRLYLALDPDAADETQRLVRNHFGDVELYDMKAVGRGAEKADLGAMGFDEVWDLFRSAPRIRAGQLFVYVRDPLEVLVAG